MPRILNATRPKAEAPSDAGGVLDLVDHTSAPRTPPPTTEVSPETADLVKQRRRNEIAAEELFNKLANDGSLTADERNFLRGLAPRRVVSYPQFEHWLKGQTNRVAAVKQKQATCGTPAERQAAQDRLVAAQETLDERRPEILAAIAKLQAELATYQESVRAAEFDIQRRQEALEFLTREDKLPSYVKEALQVLRLSIAEDKAEVGRLSGIVKTYEWLSRLDGDQAEDRDSIFHHAVAKDFLGGRLLDHVLPLKDGQFVPVVGSNPRVFNRDGWQQYLAALKPERDAALDQLSRLGDVDQRIAGEAALLRDHFVPK